MKKKIEEKLGCTIEEYVKSIQDEFEWATNNDMDIDRPSSLKSLSEDELMFLAGYTEHMLHEEDRRSA